MFSYHNVLEFFGFDTDPIIGLDIGLTAVKILQLSKSGDRIKVEHYAMVPLEHGVVNEKNIIDSLLEQYKHFSNELKFSKREKLVRSLAKQQSLKTGIRLTEREMRRLVTDLFDCEQPNTTPEGNPTYLEFKQDQLEKMFGK